MFCTSLRRRASFRSAIPALTALPEPLLRESQLETHDISIPLDSDNAATSTKPSSRHLRFLLLSPSPVTEAKLQDTLKRISHFASLTGGHHLAIVFLLQSLPAATFISASQYAKDTASNAHHATEASGMYAYSLLQTILSDHSEIPYIPILPLASLVNLPTLLQKHLASSKQTSPPTSMMPTPPTAMQLLQLCSANPPLPPTNAMFLSDVFSSFRELAAVCTSVSSVPGSSSPSARAAVGSSQVLLDVDMTGMDVQTEDGSVDGKLKRLRNLVGEQQCIDIVEFWREEWALD